MERDAGTRVLVAGGDFPRRESLVGMLDRLGAIIVADDAEVVLLLGANGDGSAVVRSARRRFPSTPLIFIPQVGSEALAVDVFRAGADDYLALPPSPEGIEQCLARVRARRRSAGKPAVLRGDSSAIVELREVIRRIAPTPCSVLISGETGTGKDLVARLLHESSGRAGRPFVSVNCSALPETLFESELFGYERGAFTGAQASSLGRLQAADGGTVFLDEVGELSLTTQPKLLRTIDQREVQRLGSRRHETIDVRWVAATNRDLRQDVLEGLFRADLFYRLNVYTLVIPPLRERADDIVVLAKVFLEELSPAYGLPGAVFTDEAILRLIAYDWPGNVRELRNVVESSILNSESSRIGLEALPGAVRGADYSTLPQAAVDRVRVVEALRASGGNKSEAAQRLNCSRMTLYRKLQRHGLDVTFSRDTVTARLPRV
jgi:DNA-binding NtrC family response regulator